MRDSPYLSVEPARRSNQAFRLLQFGFVAAPLLAGVDKFTNRMTRWTHYLAPQVKRRVDADRFMHAVGAVEIAAAALVALKPRWGGLVVAGWLGGIIGNLLLGKKDYDVALRDLGLAIGALSMARLAR
jgi:hypothetical protein